MPLKGKNVIIFGGSSGIGFSTAKIIADQGAHVILVSRDEAKLHAAQKEIGKRAETYPLDITSNEQLTEFFEKVPPFDHVVVSASPTIFGPFLELDIDSAHHFFDTKFWGAYRVALHGAPKINHGGSFTFISGVASTHPFPDLSCGGAINAALESLVRSLAMELAPLRFNAISPGVVDTPAWERIDQKERKELFQAFSQNLPAERVGEPDDIAKGIIFLIDNTYITGTTLVIDGGHLQT